MNIRIGNDVTLNITLDADKMSDKTIRSAKCHLINVDKPKSYIPKSSEYTIHGCGAPHYYCSAGAYPHDRGLNVCGYSCPNGCNKTPYVYTTDVGVLSNTLLMASFPKERQASVGRYRLVLEIVAEDRSGCHVYTFDYGAVFRLTNDAIGYAGEAVVNVPNMMGSIQSIRSVNRVISVQQNTSLQINEEDNYGSEYAVIITTITGDSIAYNPTNWPYSNIIFRSSNPAVVQVDEHGTLTIAKSKIGRDVVINVYNEDDPSINTEIVVHVLGSDSQYTAEALSTQVYDPINQMNQSEINSSVLAGIHAIENLVGKTVDDMYIVVTTQDDYDRLSSMNQIRHNTFYFTYDAEEYPGGDDEPDVPPTGAYVLDGVLYVNGTVNNGILTISGTVNNNTLIL